MELFTVTRYKNNDQTETEPKDEHEDRLLKKLLKKARKRKIEEEKINTSTLDEQKNVEQKLNLIKEIQETNKNNEEISFLDEHNKSKENFQILGNDVFKRQQKVNMILPQWLAYPTIISTNKTQNDNKLLENHIYLSPKIIENLKKMGIVSLFPVQKQVVPSILNAQSKPFPFKPRDICVSAPTGSGKTLAFGIPLIQTLMNRIECKIRALVVLPVNELALQVFKVLKSLADGTILSIGLLSKSCSFIKEQEILIDFYEGQYYSKVDIIVTTPGRLVEHLHSTKGFCLKNLKYLVIDEADRIMEQIHFNWLYHLDENVRKTSDAVFSGSSTTLCLQELMETFSNQPQKLLFSATLSHDPEKLINLKLFQPKLFTTMVIPIEKMIEKLNHNMNGNIDDLTTKNEVRGEFIGKYATPSELTEKMCICTNTRTRPLTLFALIKENNWTKFLCFTNSGESAQRLSKVLNHFFESEIICELSAVLTVKKRAEVLDNFTKTKIKGLICSDALARGIDIPGVDIVISYDAPRHITSYIHRIGRTARAGRPGTAITLLSIDEVDKFKTMLFSAGKTITEEIKANAEIEEQYAKSYTTALYNLQKQIHKEKRLEMVKNNIIKSQGTKFKKGASSYTLSANPIENIQNQLENKMKSVLLRDGKKIPHRYRRNKKIKVKK